MSDRVSRVAPRLDSNRHRHQAFLGFLKHLPQVALPAASAAIVYGVSVDSLCRRNRPRRASRIGGRPIRVRVDDLDRLFRPIPTGRPPLRKAW